ncbi:MULTISPECIES: DUF6143 family protein [Clostridium]|uniref:Uncharacterized protein n=1 Tax=Clostridium ragsdalei P11 TaxID=1353534 RepID=A0A1A6AYH3_9CLOT|nr:MULTISPECIES: DUF6143 family protein [Clostridium]OBR95085.1 hypothetical protein CLRAG_09230 [Clostridium ragsdalei P11]QXE20630.1 hypothetical protein B5S50_18210 [Clostridium sp. 001]
MGSCNNNKKSVFLANPITQVASMPYALYLSLQGKYFVGATDELEFGNSKSAWAGLFNPNNSGVNLHVYFWQVSNTGQSPIRAQIWFNSQPSGNAIRVTTVIPGNTALCPPPKPKIGLFEAINVINEPLGGKKAFVRRALPDVTVGDEEVGKFIFPPGGSFLIFLSNPETPNQSAAATVGYAWWEEKIIC